jgi:tripartite-type tricarboxylate transporter receptor subunit TctC
MKLARRHFLNLAASAVALPAIPTVARAEAYPSRPVRCIVPYPPGGPTDVAARPLALWLSERLGQPFVIENRPGASTNLGTEAVVRATPDGYTLLMFTSAQAINATLYNKLNYNFIRDIAPVAGFSREAVILVVNPSFPATTIPEFIVHAKTHPGKINVATGGKGTTGHVVGELFKMMTGIDIVHVPYRGGLLALTDVMSGHVQAMFSPVSGAIEQVKTGKLRALGVTTARRLDALPQLPTVGEFVPGHEGSFWSGVGAPQGTPAEIIGMLNKEVNAALADVKLKARLADLGTTALPGSPAEFSKLVVDETEKWAKVIKVAGITPE